MKKFWKVLGITAAVAALTPYRMGKDEETGEKKVEALLWRATAGPKDGEEMAVDIKFGFNSPFAPKNEVPLFEEPLFDEEPVAEFEIPADQDAACTGEQTAEDTAQADPAAAESSTDTPEAAAEAEIQAVEAEIAAAQEKAEAPAEENQQ